MTPLLQQTHRCYTQVVEAASTFDENRRASTGKATDELYAECLTLRTVPFRAFLIAINSTDRASDLAHALPFSSVSEAYLLKALGLPSADRKQIQGLYSSPLARRASSIDGSMLDEVAGEEELASLAIVRLAAHPPAEVGNLQRRTSEWLLRPYPNGLRFSGKNMHPLPCWLVGAQSITLNMSNNDHSLQFHFALFNGTDGYVLKPPEMCLANAEYYWPSYRERLQRTAIQLLSLHQLPKLGEQRPRYNGTRSGCHDYHRELSGASVMPNHQDPSHPTLTVALYPIGGFCAVTKSLPLPQMAETKIEVDTIKPNGINTTFGESIIVYCITAEPHATILRVSVTDHGVEVAYETALIGRLRCGFRVLQLRGKLGTRIELCFLFVRISRSSEINTRGTPQDLELQLHKHRSRIDELEAQVALTAGASQGLQT